MTSLSSALTEHRPPVQVVPTDDRLKTLIVDDNRIDRRRLKSFCTQAKLDLDFVEASSVAELELLLEEIRFDLIFIDYRLDDGDGLGALTLIKKSQTNKDTATIMVAGVGQAAIAVSALKSGCSDYLLKDALDPHWLKRAVNNAIEKSRLQRRIASAERQRVTMTSVLRDFSRDCAEEIKPMVSHMLQTVRQIEDNSGPETSEETRARLESLAQACEQLWVFAEGIDRVAQQTITRQWDAH